MISGTVLFTRLLRWEITADWHRAYLGRILVTEFNADPHTTDETVVWWYHGILQTGHYHHTQHTALSVKEAMQKIDDYVEEWIDDAGFGDAI